jgi:putative SOS response-associated peptidase YedK
VTQTGSMTGRFVVTTDTSELVAMLDIDHEAENLPAASFNVAPGDRVAVLIDAITKNASVAEYDPENPGVLRRLESASRGLVPGGAPSAEVGATLFNAPVEEVLQNPAFAPAAASRRAAIPATGYYVWHKGEDGSSSAQFVHSPDGEPLLLAALYEWWKNPALAPDDPARWLLSTTILTRASGGPLALIHERMPVLIEPGLLEDWLDPRTPGSPELIEALADAALDLAEDVEFYEVSKDVASVKNNSEALFQPV